MLIAETVVFTIIEGAAYGPETASDDESCAGFEVTISPILGGQLRGFCQRPFLTAGRFTAARKGHIKLELETAHLWVNIAKESVSSVAD